MHITLSATFRSLRPRSLALYAAINIVLALAQSAASAAETINNTATLEEIVVSARRREENIQDVPVAVTALTAETLRDLSISQTDDLRFAVPGFTIAGQVSKDSPTLVIRGQRRALGGDATPAVITYFADVPLPNDGSIVPTYDIQSIQVLKGPQGTLFGRNTTGGALLMYPTAPSYDFGGYGKLTAGNYNTRNVEGALNAPLIDGKLALRIGGQIVRQDGYTENVGVGPDLDDRHMNSVRVSLLWEPTDNLHNTTIFDDLSANEAGTGLILAGTYPAPGVPGGGGARTVANTPFFDCGVPGCDVDIALQDQQALGPRKTITNIAPYSKRTIWGVANTTVFELPAFTIKNIFGLRSTYVEALNDADGSPLSLFHLYRIIDTRQTSDELQMFGHAFNKQLDWIVGAFYLQGEPGDIEGTAQRAFVKPTTVTRMVEDFRETKTKALFGQVGYDLSALLSGLKFDLGYRYTWDDGSTCAISTPETGALVTKDNCLSAGGTPGEARSTAPTWTIGFNYRPIDQLLVYLESRRGYRSAGFNSPQFATVFAAYQNYGPEKLTDFELGVKTDWQLGTWRGRVNLAAYRGKYEGIQRSITLTANMDGDNNPANDPTTMILNAAEATVSGEELEVTVKPTDNLTLSLTGSHTDAHYDKFEAPAIFVPLLGSNPVDNRFSYTPEVTATAGVRYAIPLDHDGEIVFNANYFWSDKIWYVERPLDTNGIQPSYSVVNLRADWNAIASQPLDLSLYVRNALDKEYATAGGVVTPSITSTTLVYSEPRMFGLELRYRFGK